MRPPALVTGAPGWLGSRLVTALVGGLGDVPGLAIPEARHVRCLVLSGTPRAALADLPAGVELVFGDVRDPRSLAAFVRGAEGATIFHACGVIRARRLDDFHAVNVEGTRHLLEAAAAAGVARVIGISSDAVVGSSRRPDEVFDERSPPRPRLPYGRSKRLMEDLLRDACAAGRTTTVILRPCRFYGPGQPPARTQFYRLIRQGRLPIFDGGRSRWSFSYVDDVCQAALLAERTRHAGGETYWIADGRSHSIAEIVDTIERLLETELGLVVRHRRLRLPAVVARAAGVTELWLERLGLVDWRLHGIARLGVTVACSIAKAERELGYAPTVGLEEGLRRSLRWCRDHGEVI